MSEGKQSKLTIDDLAISLEALNLKIPSVSMEEFEDEVEAYAAGAESITEGVTGCLELASKKETLLNQYAGDKIKTKIAKAKWEESEREGETYITECLGHEVVWFKMAAATAYLKFILTQNFKSAEEAKKALEDLEKRGLLKKDARGPINIGYERFSVSRDFGLDQDDIKIVEKHAAEMSRKLLTLVSQTRQLASEAMQKIANISIEELFSGKKSGNCYLAVPPEQFLDREGKSCWRGGGNMVVFSTQGNEVIPVLATGSIEKSIGVMKDMDVRLQRHCLGWEAPPGGNENSNAFGRLMDSIMDRRSMDRQEAYDYACKLRAFWYLIIRAKKVDDAEKKLKELRESFRKRAEISQVQFFGLNGSEEPQPGIVCLEFQGVFSIPGKPQLFNAFALIRRGKEGETKFLEVVDFHENSGSLFEDVLGKKYREDEDFQGLPVNLRRFVRAVYSQQQLANDIAR